MGKPHVRRYIHSEKGNTRSVHEQVQIAHTMWDHGYRTAAEDGPKRNTVEEVLDLDLEFQARTSLGHLEEIDIVEAFQKPGPNTYVIADWHPDVFIMGDVEGAAREGLEALIEHVHDDDMPPGHGSPAVADGSGVTLRHVVANAFDLEPDALERFLRDGDPVDKLNRAVDVIDESEDYEPREGYGPIRFINTPYHYRLTAKAVRLYEK